MTEPILSISKLSKTFAGPDGGVEAVKDISFEVTPGEFMAMHGPSGCGKSTLLLMLGGLLSPDRGELIIGGENPYALAPDARAQFRANKIGFVFQQFYLVPYLSVLDNVLIPELAQDIPGAEQKAKDLLNDFQLGERINHVPSELSVGEQQRVALARALLNDPAVILADEPTGNLDDANSKVVLDALSKAAASGKAVVMVTHDERARATCHRRLSLEKGRLIAEPSV